MKAQDTLRTRRFWLDTHRLMAPAREYRELRGGVRLTVGGGASLVVKIRPDHEEGELWLRRRLRRSAQLGWYDGTTRWTAALRWSEVDAIGRAVARAGGAAHPGLPVLLLAAYAPILSDAEAGLAWALTSEAWDRLGLFDAAERRELFSLWDRRARAWRWRERETGWVIEGTREREVDGDRTDENQTFPHAWLARIEASAGRAPPPDLPAPPAWWSQTVVAETRSTGDLFGPQALGGYLDRALRDARLGWADTVTGVAGPRTMRVVCQVSSDQEQSAVWARLADALRAYDPEGSLRTGTEPAVDLAPAATPSGRYGRLRRLVVLDRRVRHVASSRPLTAPQREVVAAALRRAPRGLELQVAGDVARCERLDGVSVVVDLDEGIEALFALGRAAELCFYPPHVAFTEEAAAALRVAEPDVILARTPEALAAALSPAWRPG